MLNRLRGLNGVEEVAGFFQVIEQLERGTELEPATVQLGNLPGDWKYRTYASKAVSQKLLLPPDWIGPVYVSTSSANLY